MPGEGPVRAGGGFPGLTAHDPSVMQTLRVCANEVGELFAASGSRAFSFTYGGNGLMSEAVLTYTKDGNTKTKTVTFTYDGSNRISGGTKVIA